MTRNNLESLAEASWSPHFREMNALQRHQYTSELGRVDQIWPYLASKYGSLIAVHAPHCLPSESYQYGELSERISSVAAAFTFLGLEKSDVVAFFSENSPRWLVVDQAIMRIEASNAVRGASAPPEELRYILGDCSAVALVVQNASVLAKISLDKSERSRFKFILQLEGESIDPDVLSWDQLLSMSIGKKAPNPMIGRGPESADKTIATILYTSGTTGNPKGVPLTHGNLLHQISSLACVAYPKPGSPVLSVLPIWHAYERSAEYYFFSCGCTQNYSNIKQLKKDLQRVKPVVMVTVPRLWEAVKEGFEEAVKKMSPIKQQIIRGALANSAAQKFALRVARGLLIEPVPLENRLIAFLEASVRWPMHILASLILWPKVLEQLSGGRLLFPINGGGAIAPHVDTFFESLGVELLVGYGLTETSPVVSCRRPWRNIRGSSGLPLPKTEFRIVDLHTRATKNFFQQGLVLVKGPQVMKGYLLKPDASAKVLGSDGWFETGDLGMLLPDGSLVLTGRAKDTIVLSSGENIEPGPLEEALLSSPLIDQVMMVGQDERQLGALIVPNYEKMLHWSLEKGLSLSEDLGGLPGNFDLRVILRSEVNRLLAKRNGSRPEERVLGVALVNSFSIENGMLTQTLKQRREKISYRDNQAIAEIFQR